MSKPTVAPALRPLLVALLLGASLASAALAAAPAALANGIIVTSGDVIIVEPLPPHHPRRPVPPRPRPPVRLKGHRVQAKLADRIADVTVEQTFHNDSGMQLEGTYLFPLPEGAAVSKFAMTMGGKMVEGEILPAGEARRIYEDIVRRRRDPGLLEYAGRGLFKARVFPIEPHSDLTIRIAFQQILAEDAGTLEWRYPLATERLNAAAVEDVLVDVAIESPVAIRALYSPSHDVAVVREGDKKARVTYERARTTQDRDFLLYVGRSPEDVGFSLLSTKGPGEDGTFLAVFAPRTEVPAGEIAAKDVVFVLDTSGSMQGPKMEQARKALIFGVRSLQPGDRFNLIAFATGLQPFRDGLLEATAEAKEAAVKWIEGLQAAGGTNIEGALSHAMPMLAGGRLPMVVFLTDGRPTVGERNPETLVKMVEGANGAKARVFTFGVGYDLDVGLLDRIAETTRGARDYVTPEEDIEVATGRFFRKVQQPVLTDVKVELGSGVHDVYPQRLGDLFAGGQVMVLGRYREAGARTIRLSGRVGAREVVFEYASTLRAEDAAPFLPRLWAHRKVAFLLDEVRLHGENKEVVDEIVRLATRHGIVTPYTAGLVVEESELAGRTRGPVDDVRDGRGGLTMPRGFGGRSGGGAMPPPGDAGAPPSTPSPSAPAAEAAKASEDLKRRKEDLAEGREAKDEASARAQERVQAVEGKTFLLGSDGRWVDTTYDGKMEVVKVEAYSEAWFELSRRSDKVSRWLALGDRVLVVLDGKAYEVHPAP